VKQSQNRFWQHRTYSSRSGHPTLDGMRVECGGWSEMEAEAWSRSLVTSPTDKWPRCLMRRCSYPGKIHPVSPEVSLHSASSLHLHLTREAWTIQGPTPMARCWLLSPLLHLPLSASSSAPSPSTRQSFFVEGNTSPLVVAHHEPRSRAQGHSCRGDRA